MTNTQPPRAGLIYRRQPTQRTRNTKLDMRIGTWNVKTMLQAGKLQEIAEVLNKYAIDITAVQEIRWKGAGRIDKPTFTLFYSGNNLKQGERGVGFILSKSVRKAVLEFEPINDRICKLRIKGKFYNITFISAYAPTEQAKDEDIEYFYSELNATCDKIPKHDALILLGDFNAKIGKEDVWKEIAGHHSLHDETSNNGEMLCSLAMSTNLIIKSTCFPHKDVHKGTWVMPGSRGVNQIDHILINKRRASSILDVRSMRGANCDSDHYLVRSLLRQRIAVNAASDQYKGQRWNTDILTNETVQNTYKQKIKENMAPMTEDNVEEDWQNIKNCIVKAAEEVIGKKKGGRNEEWFDAECRAAIKEKNEARLKAMQVGTRSNKQEYQKLRTVARNICKRKKREFYNHKLEELNSYNTNKESRKFYKEIRMKTKEYNPKLTACESKTGEKVTDETEILSRWKEYFHELLNRPSVTRDDVRNSYQSAQPEDDEPTYEEVKSVILKLKNNKAPGTDSITAELLKFAGESVWQQIHKLVTTIWKQEKIPEEWRVGIICPVYKKGRKTQCENYRGITLLNITYKVLSSIIYNHLAKYAESILGEYQAGFRRGRSTSDHLHTMRQMLEKCYEHNITTHTLYVDYKQAFDSVDKTELLNRLTLLGIPAKLVRLIEMTLCESQAAVKIGPHLTSTFEINSGVRQGDALSTLLFNLVLESVIRRTNTSGTLRTKPKQLLAYADDIAISTKNLLNLEETLSTLQTESEKVGLTINAIKTKYMLNSRIQNHDVNPITLNGQQFEKVNNFTYLGSRLNAQNLVSEEIQARILAGNRALFSYKKLLCSKILTRSVKLKIYKTLIRPIVTYACETWTLKQKDLAKIEIFERRVLRKIFGPTQERSGRWRIKMNFELEELINKETIVRFIKYRRLQWFGHLMRMKEERVPLQFTNWTPWATRSRGRPRKKWKDEVIDDIRTMRVRNWTTAVQDRKSWKEIVEQAKTHPGL